MNQPRLIPDDIAVPDTVNVPLDRLPPDSMLTGAMPNPKFMESIAQYGVLQPIILTRGQHSIDSDSHYSVVAGRSRIKAARAAGLTHIPARIYPSDWTSEQVLTLVENHQRTHNAVSDLKAIEELLAKGATEQDVCMAVGIRKQTLRHRMKLLNLHPVLREALELGKISIWVAEITASQSQEMQEKLVSLYRNAGKLRGRDIKEIRSVQSEQILSSFPQDIFGETKEDWRVLVRIKLHEALAAVPERVDGNDPTRRAVSDALLHTSVGSRT